MKRELFRVPVKGPVDAYKSYVIRRPKATHFRPGTCQEAECDAYEKGWVTRAPWGSAAAEYIASGRSERYFQETTDLGQMGIVREFVFAPGQKCFADHQIPLDRDPLFIIRDGDYRGNPTGRITPVKVQDWIDDLGENQEAIANRLKEG